jgi:hypothetical protein
MRGSVAFAHAHRGARTLLVGEGGVPVEDFLATHPSEWLGG